MVENFPATQTVDVRGFPHVVTVEGTVDVGNLPLDEDGNVRVSNPPSGNPTFKFFRLPDLFPQVGGVPAWSDLIDVSGWRSMDVIIRINGGALFVAETQVGFIDPDVGPIFTDPAARTSIGAGDTGIFSAEVTGPEMRVGIRSIDGAATAEVWVYLSN